ncbi:MAG TPA: hypothetical protein PLD59_10975 [Tepidisphaeraceae bacterium]|nr:hypothetical protein [Tepidisphaeraceae bacterium]
MGSTMTRLGLWDYVKAAFNARPLGMFVPPNWVLIGAFTALGFLNPGFWVVGAGVELAYLVGLASNKRFQRFVVGRRMSQQNRMLVKKQEDLLRQLSVDDRAAYLLLDQRCDSILEQQKQGTGVASRADLAIQSEGLGRLMWIYLRLLVTRAAIVRLLHEAAGNQREGIDARVRRLKLQIDAPEIGVELRRSLEGQLQILEQRAASQREARDNLAFIESELTRIREQVELIKEQSVLSNDPSTLSMRIDEVGSSLNSTTQWMRDRQDVFGKIEAMMEEPHGRMMAE